MTHPGYILTCWFVSLGAVGIYSLRLVRRGRTLSRAVPEALRRWMTTEEPKS